MRSVPNYRNGIVIEYASNAVARAGSCIFIYIWRRGTAGCVAADENTVLELQRWGHAEGAHVAIYSKRHAAQSTDETMTVRRRPI
jgi:L,D-peptidoglycan transpeptidase YkuD (ErfK/YbiS/YcfS/YnhG family)